MKNLLFAALLMITSIAAFSQEQPKRQLPNQFSDYTQFQKDHQVKGNFHQRPEFRPYRFPMHPKPERIIVKGDKVIVIFNKADFLRLRPEVIEKQKTVFKERERSRLYKLMEEKFNQ